MVHPDNEYVKILKPFNQGRIMVFISSILVTYILVDCIKILLAKQLKHKLTIQEMDLQI